ncbi:E3 ubiquitin-protein ligase MIB2-like [Strongylocentrotus purpuratus]|uniref:RING-type E3 ubiquitin transferase n=1 Tax=Strongylocentrotus purpuratus TaxID=7668 RepID=A0A7M7NVK3_STRPU|nr:E3 ubiquitin-protein ligase MIB2-like [Strongylocentrotus purpuratus]
MEVGQRVVRSATWTWRDQDGGEGHLGTVVKLKDQDPQEPIPKDWAKIRWDNGNVNNYQVGSSGSYDLALFDNAPAGVNHVHITCDSCSMNPIAGIRWKCSDQSCPDYDLCTPCYMNDKHDLTHRFTRFTSRKETGTQVTPRFGEAKTVSRGLCPEAEVCRGKDWQGDDEDGAGGTVVEICPFSKRPRSGVTVCWTQSKLVTTHRVGFDGKMDLKCTAAGTGIDYYATHLPVLGKEVGLKVGDLVAITLDSETLQIMQQMGGREWLPAMGNLYGKVAKVTGINLDGNAEVTYPERKEQPFTFNPDVLNKVPRLSKGDRVQINKDLTFVMNLQENSQNGWIDGMEKCLGMEGTVMNVDSQYNSRVRLIGLENLWSWHPCSLILVKKNSSDDDKQSAESTGLKLDGSGQTEFNKALLSLLGTDSGEGGEGDGHGQTKMLKALLSLLQTKDGSSSNSDSGEGGEESQLIKAAKRGNVERVVEILSISPEKANMKVGGKTALHMAAAHGHLEVVQALLESGAEIDITTVDSGSTPLHYSVEGDEPAITKYLIGKGADINRGNDNGRRAIHQAAYKGFVDCARVLINHGCDVNVQDTEKDTPLHDAIIKSRVDVIELLVKVPDLDVTLANKRECTALQYAALRDKPEPAELIAQSCPRSIVVARDDGHTVLHICAVNDHVEVMKVVMAVKDHGLDVNAKNAKADTALHLAAHKGQSHSIEFLVSQGADINLQGRDDHTALHLLASTAGTDPSGIKDTPTLRKIRKRFRDCGVDNSAAAALCYMVLNGASIDLENVKCRTPLYYIKDAELKKTLKKIACEKISDDMSSWEDLGEDEDVKKGRLSSNSISVDDDDIIVKGNDGLSITDKGSPNRIRQDSAESESGADGRPAGNQKKSGKPKIEVFDLVHKIEVSDLDMGPVVGKGQFGVVHRASWRGTPVAVKKISIMGSRKDEIEKEVAIHRRACHPNIVQMMALGYQEKEAFLVMQFIEGPSLHTVIFPDRDDVKIPLDWAKKLQISREVLQAVTFMHACNILHLDIKPANILVDSATIRPYICDLGLAHIKNRNLMSQSAVNIRGTPCFMPPEALGATEPGYRHSNKHDIWSVAGTLVELYSMKRLWGDSMNPLALMARILTGQMSKPESLTAVDSKVQKILEPCFRQKPEKRPSASDLLDQFNDLT